MWQDPTSRDHEIHEMIMKLESIILFLAIILMLSISITLNLFFDINPLITISYGFVYLGGCYAFYIIDRYNL
jgi:hypothetical protein